MQTIVGVKNVCYNKAMKKLFNYRPLVSICLFAIAGIVFASSFYIADIFHFILAGISLALTICTIVVKCVKVKDKKLFKVLSVAIAFVLFAGLTLLNAEIIKSANNNFNGVYKVYGRVTDDVYVSKKGKYVISLDHAYVIEENGNYKKVRGKVMLYLDSDDGRSEDFAIGSTIVSTVNVSKPKFSFKQTYFYYANKGVSLTGYGSEAYSLLVGTKDRNLAQKYKLSIKDSLSYWLDEDYSELAYTMLFGDRGELDDDISKVFSASGIAHLLAVSGLHVGFIVTLLSFVLGLCQAGDKTKFFVVSAVTFIYAFLCGFTISVIRAFVMTFVMLYLKMRRKEYDSLSALSLAAILILLVCPSQIYSAGFRLSFGAVLGIILLAKTFERFFARAFHKKLASALAVSISAQIGTLPTLILCFKNLSIFSIVANLLAIPVASIAFMIMFSFSIFGIIFKPLGFGLVAFKWLMWFVTLIGRVFGSITLASANYWWIIAFTFTLIASVMFMTDYTFLEKKPKIWLSSSCFAICAVCLVLAFVL